MEETLQETPVRHSSPLDVHMRGKPGRKLNLNISRPLLTAAAMLTITAGGLLAARGYGSVPSGGEHVVARAAQPGPRAEQTHLWPPRPPGQHLISPAAAGRGGSPPQAAARPAPPAAPAARPAAPAARPARPAVPAVPAGGSAAPPPPAPPRRPRPPATPGPATSSRPRPGRQVPPGPAIPPPVTGTPPVTGSLPAPAPWGQPPGFPIDISALAALPDLTVRLQLGLPAGLPRSGVVRGLVAGGFPPFLPARFAAHPQVPEPAALDIRLPRRGAQAGRPPDQHPPGSKPVTEWAVCGPMFEQGNRHAHSLPRGIAREHLAQIGPDRPARWPGHRRPPAAFWLPRRVSGEPGRRSAGHCSGPKKARRPAASRAGASIAGKCRPAGRSRRPDLPVQRQPAVQAITTHAGQRW